MLNINTDISGALTPIQIAVLYRHGVALSDDAVAEFINQEKRSLQVQQSDGTFPIKSHRVVIGDKKRGRRMYDFRDVADWWDSICTEEK